MVRISAVVIWSREAKLSLVHIWLVCFSQFVTAACSAAVCAEEGGGLTGAGPAPPQPASTGPIPPRIAIRATFGSEKDLPVRFISVSFPCLRPGTCDARHGRR